MDECQRCRELEIEINALRGVLEGVETDRDSYREDCEVLERRIDDRDYEIKELENKLDKIRDIV